MTFATIVGLLSDFNASRQGRAATSMEEFKAWLAEQRHADIVDALDQNAATMRSVKALLHEDRESLAKNLRALDEQLAKLATGLELFKPLAMAVHPGTELSEQAIEILQQIDAAGASKFLKGSGISGDYLAMIDGRGGGDIKLSDPRFLESDIRDLRELGLITHIAVNGNYDNVYSFNRSAAALVKARRE
jgi:hypothetical protein